MTGQERDYEELLSRVLHSTADQIEPVGDGLTKIRARMSESWLKRQWWLVRSEFMVLGWLVAVRCESFRSTIRSRTAAAEPGALAGTGKADPRVWSRWLAPALRWLAPALRWLAPALRRLAPALRRLAPVIGTTTAWVSSRGPGRGHADGPRRTPGPVMNWLRPALAVAGAVVLVVAGVFALGQLRQTIVGVSAGGSGGPAASGGSSQTGAGRTNSAHGGRVIRPRGYRTPRGAGLARPGSTSHTGTSPSPSPCATPSSPPVNQSPSPTPPASTPSPTTSPTPTSNPTPTSSPTATSSSSSAPLNPLRALDNRGTAGTRTAGTRTAGTRTATLMCGPSGNPSPSNLASPA